MTLHLTPEMLEATYEFIRKLPPANRWKLLEADDVEFRVTHAMDYEGLFDTGKDGTPRISVSARKVGRLDHLLETVWHETIHLYLDESGTGDRGEHGAEFNRLKTLVCKYNGFDPKRF